MAYCADRVEAADLHSSHEKPLWVIIICIMVTLTHRHPHIAGINKNRPAASLGRLHAIEVNHYPWCDVTSS